MTATPTSAPFHGFFLAVGGQTRKVGKSALIVDILKAFPDRNWTGVKITPYAESGCPLNGATCNCGSNEHLYVMHSETQHEGKTDSSRFLAAGARRALWLQTKEGQLEAALPALADELKRGHAYRAGARTAHAIIESDALVKFWNPSLFLMVLDPANPDFKNSARENLARADAFVLRSPQDAQAQNSHTHRFLQPALIELPAKSKFLHPLGAPMPQDLRQFLSGSIP